MKNQTNNLFSYVQLFFEMFAEVISLLRQLANQKKEIEKSYDSADVKILLVCHQKKVYYFLRSVFGFQI